MREQWKRWLAIGMIVVALLVFFLVFGRRRVGLQPLVPALVPMVGMTFGFVFALAQVGYCLYFCGPKGVILLAVVWVIAAPLTTLAGQFGLHPQALSGLDRMVTGSASASALLLGFFVLNGKL